MWNTQKIIQKNVWAKKCIWKQWNKNFVEEKDARQISEQLCNFKPKSCSFQVSQDLVNRCLIA